MTETKRMTVAKIEKGEIDELRSFLQSIGEKVKDSDYQGEDCKETNEEIGKLVRQTFPHRPAFIAPLNLEILINNYQDEESDILAHPKWLVEMYELLEEIDDHLSSKKLIPSKNHIESGSILHQKIKKYVSNQDTSKTDT